MIATKKYFGTDGIRGRVGEFPITAEFVLKLGWAVGCVLAHKGGSNKVLIGKDTRISGYMFESALEAGLSSAGVDIHLLGPMPTPAIAYLTRTQRAQAGIVISASHNPYYDNGIKFFSDQGTKLPDELEIAIEHHLELPMTTVDSAKLGRATRIVDAPGRYIEFCKSTLPPHVTLKGMKIIVDCANGATYHVAPDVFRELGADVLEISVNPDGFNINENCGSTQPTLLQRIVLAEQADLGIALDGDGDRVVMVDHKGEILDGDELLYIIAKNCLATDRLQGGVVGTEMSNLGLELSLRQLGIDFARAKVGDRHVLTELKKLGWLLGGETSGHLVWLNATTTGDGIISALQVLSAMHHSEQTLHAQKTGMIKFPQAMLNVPMKSESNPLQQPHVQAAVRDAEAKLAGRGRVFLRPSGTEPLIRIMVEGENHVLVKQLAESLAAIIQSAIP
jgi:phosphoglucosamine mutase